MTGAEPDTIYRESIGDAKTFFAGHAIKLQQKDRWQAFAVEKLLVRSSTVPPVKNHKSQQSPSRRCLSRLIVMWTYGKQKPANQFQFGQSLSGILKKIRSWRLRSFRRDVQISGKRDKLNEQSWGAPRGLQQSFPPCSARWFEYYASTRCWY